MSTKKQRVFRRNLKRALCQGKYNKAIRSWFNDCIRFRKSYPDRPIMVNEDACGICPKPCWRY